MPSGKADSPILIRPARPNELARLSLLCLRSKAVWSYSADFLAACRPALMLRPADLDRSHLAVAERRGHAVGVVQATTDGAATMLDKIYVAPPDLRTGIGTVLFAEALRVARAAQARELVIDSDPGAGGFFTRMGAHSTGEVAFDCVPGWTLPRFILPL